MVVYYLAAIYPLKYCNIYQGKQISPAYRFNQLLAEGFSVIPGIEVKCLVPRIILSKLDRKVQGKREQEGNLTYIFLEVDGNKYGYYNYLKKAVEEIEEESRREQVVLICDVLSINFLLLCLWCKRKFQLPNIGIITDFPQYVGGEKKKIWIKLLNYIHLCLMKKMDHFVLLTEEMGKIVNRKGHPQCIMEGICNIQEGTAAKETKYHKRVCLYAGSLHKEYGIALLIEAFLQAAVPKTELHIYGDGNYKDEIEKICAGNQNVFYCGIKPNSFILKEERKATLLINPRPTAGEYTKYSFPSKTLEYMASGTPLLMTKLPGLPKCYYPFLYLFEEETLEGYVETLKRVMSQSEEALKRKGEQAKEFVLENKNNYVQAERIIRELQIVSLEKG